MITSQHIMFRLKIGPQSIGQLIVYGNPNAAADAKKPQDTITIIKTLIDLNKVRAVKEGNRKAHYVFTSVSEERELAISVDEAVGMQCYELVK